VAAGPALAVECIAGDEVGALGVACGSVATGVGEPVHAISARTAPRVAKVSRRPVVTASM
jgi:hypothetical protein